MTDFNFRTTQSTALRSERIWRFCERRTTQSTASSTHSTTACRFQAPKRAPLPRHDILFATNAKLDLEPWNSDLEELHGLPGEPDRSNFGHTGAPDKTSTGGSFSYGLAYGFEKADTSNYWTRYARKWRESVARVTILRAAASVVAYQYTTGSWPGTWSEALDGQSPPVDPRSGYPLQLKVANGECLINAVPDGERTATDLDVHLSAPQPVR